jgi:hypothetical protein
VAWPIPSLAGGWCWQAVFREFTRLFPKTEIFIGAWPGLTLGFEDTFRVRVVRGLRVPNFGKEKTDAAKGRSWLSPALLWHLVRFRPEVILSNGIHGGTLFAVLAKALLRSRLILIWQGDSSEDGAGSPWWKGLLRSQSNESGLRALISGRTPRDHHEIF